MFDVRPLTTTIGAEVTGIDLGQSPDEKLKQQLNEALLEWKVLFFRDQDLSPQSHLVVGRVFGDLEVHPFAQRKDEHPEIMVLAHSDEPRVDGALYENVWHSDVTWREIPSKMSILRAIDVPAVGGDTLWADMYAAYENLDAGLRRYLDTLDAEHDYMRSFGRVIPPEKLADMRKAYPAVQHPVVRTHPETGRKLLYVNASFSTRIVGLSNQESDALLGFLIRQAAIPEHQCRFHWRPNSIAMWDNRCTQHYACQDYWPRQRVMERVTVIGTRPSR